MNLRKMMDLKTPNWFAMADGDAVARIDITGVIGGGFWSDGTAAESFIAECKNLNAKNIEVHICSPGGDVSEGLQIYSYLSGLKAQGKTVTTCAEGLVASIASAILMAGDKIKIAESAAVHVHNPWCYHVGNASAFRARAAELDKIASQLSGVYQARTGLDAATVADLLNGPEGADGTLLTAAEALEKGFADEIEPNKKAAACIGADIWDGIPASFAEDDPEKKPDEEETPEKKPDEEETPEEKPDEEETPEKKPDDDDDPEDEDDPEKKKECDPAAELAKLRQENAELKTAAAADAAKLSRLAGNALTPHKSVESSALSWDEAMKNCNYDYVQARTKYPAAYAAYMTSCRMKNRNN